MDKEKFIIVLICLVLSSLFFTRQNDTLTHETFVPLELNDSCPPGFKKDAQNHCVNKNLYLQYSIPNAPGVGGLKTALPSARDGFTPQQIDLGRYLFFDPVLSSDGKVSCATCHNPKKGFGDGLAASIGMDDYPLERAAPSLWNVAYLKLFFWDGRASSLEEQMQGPLFSEHEMGNSPESLVKTLNNIPAYRHLFLQAFPKKNKNESILLDEVYLAITAFQASLISLNSRYDQYAHGYHNALNQNEIEGLNVFRSFVARCAECHTPPLFTNQQIAVIGVPEPNGKELDPGAEIPFNEKTLRGGFKVPSLRNITKTSPYSHSGVFKNLKEAIRFYSKGRGHAVPQDEKLTLHWHIWEPQLSEEEVDRLVDFLHTLTDESFMPQIPETLPSQIQSQS
jgi:cytochrome c peroxidase